jgi:hypothetical protein
LTRDEALFELTRRYFASHGPARLQDFVWWSGLTTADAKAGVDMAGRDLAQEAIDGRTYWRSASTPAVRRAPRVAYLLPAYDEYLVGYKDRSAALDPTCNDRSVPGSVLFDSTIVVDGRVVGTWKRAPGKSAVIVARSPFAALRKAARPAVADAAQRYGAFLGMKAVLA